MAGMRCFLSVPRVGVLSEEEIAQEQVKRAMLVERVSFCLLNVQRAASWDVVKRWLGDHPETFVVISEGQRLADEPPAGYRLYRAGKVILLVGLSVPVKNWVVNGAFPERWGTLEFMAGEGTAFVHVIYGPQRDDPDRFKLWEAVEA